MTSSAVAAKNTQWAVVEICPDGTLGQPQLVTATGPVAAARRIPTGHQLPGRLTALLPAIDARLGSAYVVDGRLHDAVRCYTRGADAREPSPGRDGCRARLALVEAFRGDLRRASDHADLVLGSTFDTGRVEAYLAKAWVHLERAELVECRRHLDLAIDTASGSAASTDPAGPNPLRPDPLDPDPSGPDDSKPDVTSWLFTCRQLVEARLLTATGQPDAATRLLAWTRPTDVPGQPTTWLADLLRVAQAESLVAAGESQQALALLTPLPTGAIVEATVMAATAYRSIGDARGAQAVLRRVDADLARSPLTVQLQAWLLEAQLADSRGEENRAGQLVDRALRAAGLEQMRRPIALDVGWLRGFAERNPLPRTQRDFLSTLMLGDGPRRPRTAQSGRGELVGAQLTARERQVLELLAQMYSTEEIARALYVSTNTVKTHLKGIFGKLCVHRRVDAVRRGRELGIC